MTKYEDNRLEKAYYDGCKDKEKEMLDYERAWIEDLLERADVEEKLQDSLYWNIKERLKKLKERLQKLREMRTKL